MSSDPCTLLRSVDNDGTITMKEYVTWKLKECMHDDDEMFEIMQGNITKRVMYNFPLPKGHVKTKHDRALLFAKQFQAFDNDNDGWISIMEFTKQFDTHDIDKDGKLDDEVTNKFRAIDVDGDGTITMKEYVTWKLKECMHDDDEMFEVMQNGIQKRIEAANAR